MKGWLKLLCALLLIYTAVGAFIHPLTPAGLQVDIEELVPGTNTFILTGYNSHFLTEESSNQFFLAVDSTARYCALEVKPLDESHLSVVLQLPDTLSSGNFTFLANNDLDGYLIVQPPIRSGSFAMQPGYKVGSCSAQVKHADHTSFGYPYQPIIMETIRNLMWHVPMWFTMFLLMGISFAQSLRSLNAGGRSGDAIDKGQDLQKLLTSDTKAAMSASVGLVFCMLGLITGSIWARFTWGAWWTNDPQLNGAMVVFLVYAAYFILRNGTPDAEKRARLSAIFNIFAFVLMVVLLMVMPRFAEGLHPGKSGNPAFSQYDLDSSLRVIFYPAVLGYLLLGYWIYNIRLRIRLLEIHQEEHEI